MAIKEARDKNQRGYDNIYIYFERVLEISRQFDDQDKIAEG